MTKGGGDLLHRGMRQEVFLLPPHTTARSVRCDRLGAFLFGDPKRINQEWRNIMANQTNGNQFPED
jgi:hypothetical protein